MWDTVVAISTEAKGERLEAKGEDQTSPSFRKGSGVGSYEVLWTSHAGFGYEHNPAMPLEKDGTLWVSTKNGLLLGMDAKTGKVLWRHKIGNSILNTPLPLSGKECIFTSSEGTITRIRVR